MVCLRSLFLGGGGQPIPCCLVETPFKRFTARHSLVPEVTFERWVTQVKAAFRARPMARQHYVSLLLYKHDSEDGSTGNQGVHAARRSSWLPLDVPWYVGVV